MLGSVVQVHLSPPRIPLTTARPPGRAAGGPFLRRGRMPYSAPHPDRNRARPPATMRLIRLAIFATLLCLPLTSAAGAQFPARHPHRDHAGVRFPVHDDQREDLSPGAGREDPRPGQHHRAAGAWCSGTGNVAFNFDQLGQLWGIWILTLEEIDDTEGPRLQVREEADGRKSLHQDLRLPDERVRLGARWPTCCAPPTAWNRRTTRPRPTSSCSTPARCARRRRRRCSPTSGACAS